MLEIRQLEAFYGPAQALFGIDLRLQAGQLLVLQGLNGAGKSTLLKSVMGLEVATRGQLMLAGAGPAQDISDWPTYRRAGAGLGYVAEDRRLFGELTVLENLRVAGGRASGRSLDWVLERFGLLKPMLNRPAALMSGGEQQMLALARTLMTRPRLLLLDEPCEGISPVLVDAMVQVLLDLRSQGLGLLVAEQNRQLAQAADQVLELVAGTVRGRRQGAAPS
ncbi:MAG: ATP-binding cassette domain-containing protein [Betaproteobacteria bacterium]